MDCLQRVLRTLCCCIVPPVDDEGTCYVPMMSEVEKMSVEEVCCFVQERDLGMLIGTQKEKRRTLKRLVPQIHVVHLMKKDMSQPRKTTYVIKCGVKEKRGTEWVLSRMYRTVKHTLGIEDTYDTVKIKLAKEFRLLEEENLVILDMENEIVEETTFSVYDYVHKYKKICRNNQDVSRN